MHVISFGCSLTFGSDLADTPSDSSHALASKFTWPALISDQMSLPYQCYAKGGSGNLCVLDRVLSVADFRSNNLFVINWTFIDRFDYTNCTAMHAPDGIIDYDTLRPGNTDERSDFFYRCLHSTYRDKLASLLYIKSVLHLLQHHRAKFVMTAVDDLLWDTRYHAPKIITDLQNTIRPWIWDFENFNFLSWSRRKGFDISVNNHPLEAAHAAAAKLMLPAIDAILHRA